MDKTEQEDIIKQSLSLAPDMVASLGKIYDHIAALQTAVASETSEAVRQSLKGELITNQKMLAEGIQTVVKLLEGTASLIRDLA